jgi:hypothetical protein
VAAILAGRSVIAVERDAVQVNIICQRLTELSVDLTNPDINQWNVDRSGPKESEETWTIIRRGHLRTMKSRGVRLKPVRELYNIEYQPTIEQVKSADLHQANLKEGVAKEGRKADAENRKKNKDSSKMAKVGVHTKAPPPTPVLETLLPTGVWSSSSSSSSSAQVHELTKERSDDDESSDGGEKDESEEEILRLGMMDGHVSMETTDGDEEYIESLFNAETSTSDAISSATAPAAVDTNVAVVAALAAEDEKVAAAAAAAVKDATDRAAADALDAAKIDATADLSDAGDTNLLTAKPGLSMPSPSTAAKLRASTRVQKGDQLSLFDDTTAEADGADAKESTPLAHATRKSRTKEATKAKKKGAAAADKATTFVAEAYVHGE